MTFHVVNRGAGRAPVFVDQRDRIEFQRLLALAHERHGIVVHAYCQMTNHFHLVVECPDDGGLAEAMHVLGSVYVRHFNERHGRDGPLFRSRYYAKPVGSPEYLMRLVRYVHRNPLAFLPPERLASWRWSSLRDYRGDRHAPPWLMLDRVTGLFGGRQQVVDACEADLDHAAALGASDWDAVLSLAIDEHLVDSHGSRSRRTAAVLLAERLGDGDRAALDALLAFPNPRARDAARSRARRRLDETPQLGDVVETALRFAA